MPYEIVSIPYLSKMESVVITGLPTEMALAIIKRSKGSLCMSGSSVARRQISADKSITVKLCCVIARWNHSLVGSESSSCPPLYFWPISKILIAETPTRGLSSIFFRADSLSMLWLIASHSRAQVSKIIAQI